MNRAPEALLRHRWQAIKAAFDARAPEWIERFFAESAPEALPRVLRLVMAGKKARGCLACLVCEALSGRLESAMPRAVIIECVQAATLVHDDFVDDDALRRAEPATWTELGPRRAVLLGDVMFATAIVEAARLSRADVAALAEAIATIAGGAYREPLELSDLEAAPAASQKRTLYEHVVHCKTGALFGVAGRLGAIAAGAHPEQVDAAAQFATRLGEAYQMADDVADLLGPTLDLPLPPPKAAALAALRAHFEPDQGGRHRARLRSEESDATSLRPRVDREIARRLGMARREIDGFASGGPAALLHAAPRFILGLQAT